MQLLFCLSFEQIELKMCLSFVTCNAVIGGNFYFVMFVINVAMVTGSSLVSVMCLV